MAPIMPLTRAALPRISQDLTASPRDLLRRAVLPAIDRLCASVDADIPWLEALLERLEPTLSLSQVRARVVQVRAETHDTKTYVLRPNARFGSHRAGAHVLVTAHTDQGPVQRAYSLSSAPDESGMVSITVKRVPGGVLSNWLADHVRPGHVLTLGRPMGHFVLKSPLPSRLLMISAGSGITPVMSMLRALATGSERPEITFMHFARSPRDVIFREQLEQLAERMPNLSVLTCVEEPDATQRAPVGRFTRELLEQAAPELLDSEVYLCGPSGFMEAVMVALEEKGVDLARVHHEAFSPDFGLARVARGAQLVRFTRSGLESLSNRPRTILEQAESAGLKVAYGCRNGVCGSCRCTKRSGVVVHVSTGEVSTDGEHAIYPCVSVARGTVELDL
jgi:ferredoxin-NADP reductase